MLCSFAKCIPGDVKHPLQSKLLTYRNMSQPTDKIKTMLSEMADEPCIIVLPKQLFAWFKAARWQC